MPLKTVVVPGLLGEIVAGHDFNKVVRRRVFVNGSDSYLNVAAITWAEQENIGLMAKAKEEDPTFDFYDFELQVTKIDVELPNV